MTNFTPTRRSFRPTPAWLILALFVVEGLVWLSERYQWFWFNGKKGWTVLIAVAVVGGAMLVLLAWFVAALVLRRRFQFSIRSLLVLTVAVAVPCSWLAVEMKKARRQHEAADGILGVNGEVAYDWQVDAAGNPLPIAQPTGPQWLRNLLGQDFFTRVLSADINVPVQRIGPSPYATVGLEYLDGLPHLQRLSVNETKITDDEAQRLGSLHELRELNLTYVEITEDGLKEIGELTQLQKLAFFGTDVSDTGLAHLRKLVRLQSLRLYALPITDSGLVNLDGMTDLHDLDLAFSRITDAGLPHLAGLTKLESLNIHATNVTDEGAKKLQKALPKCYIDH